MKRNRYCFYLLLCALTMMACRSTKLSKNLSQEKEELEKAVNRLVDCLNNREEACLQQLYASDFISYAPTVEFSSIERLVKKTVDNFEKNQFQVSINVLDIKAGPFLAYVNLEWELMEQHETGAMLSLLIEKRLDVWKKDDKLGWQLHRSLFYKPRSF